MAQQQQAPPPRPARAAAAAGQMRRRANEEGLRMRALENARENGISISAIGQVAQDIGVDEFKDYYWDDANGNNNARRPKIEVAFADEQDMKGNSVFREVDLMIATCNFQKWVPSAVHYIESTRGKGPDGQVAFHADDQILTTLRALREPIRCVCVFFDSLELHELQDVDWY